MRAGWNYHIEPIEPSVDEDSLVKLLEDCGLGGWELVGFINLPPSGKLLAVFKQPSNTSTQK